MERRGKSVEVIIKLQSLEILDTVLDKVYSLQKKYPDAKISVRVEE